MHLCIPAAAGHDHGNRNPLLNKRGHYRMFDTMTIQTAQSAKLLSAFETYSVQEQ